MPTEIEGKDPNQYLVSGEWASKNEYNVAKALTFYKVKYAFHVDILGGSSVRGGFVIDFVVERPFREPLEVFGNYWHEGALAGEDKLKLQLLSSYYGRPPIIIWGNESETIEQAKDSVAKKVV